MFIVDRVTIIALSNIIFAFRHASWPSAAEGHEHWLRHTIMRQAYSSWARSPRWGWILTGHMQRLSCCRGGSGLTGVGDLNSCAACAAYTNKHTLFTTDSFIY